MPDLFIRHINGWTIVVVDGDGNELWRGAALVLDCLKALSGFGYIGSIYDAEDEDG